MKMSLRDTQYSKAARLNMLIDEVHGNKLRKEGHFRLKE